MTVADKSARAKPGERTPLPQTKKGLLTRAALLDAGEAIFDEKTYSSSRLSDITKRAGVAEGTFYTYFESKRELLLVLIDGLLADLETRSQARAPDLPLAERIAHINREYIDLYIERAGLLRVFEEVATIDEDFRTLRRRTRRNNTDRTERLIRRLQESGKVDAALDAHYTSFALVAMVDNFLYYWLALGEPFERAQVESSLTDLWVRCLGIQQ